MLLIVLTPIITLNNDVFNFGEGGGYDWMSVQGLPAFIDPTHQSSVICSLSRIFLGNTSHSYALLIITLISAT